MVEWIVEYYKDAQGREPVTKFIDALPVGTQAKIFRLIGLLAKYHVLLKEPYTKQIKGKLRELSGSSYSMGLSRRREKRRGATSILRRIGCRIT
jgi:phage-related protein